MTSTLGKFDMCISRFILSYVFFCETTSNVCDMFKIELLFGTDMFKKKVSNRETPNYKLSMRLNNNFELFILSGSPFKCNYISHYLAILF